MGQAVQIDVSAVRTRDELHDLLFQKLNFPDYYGGNWDAFDECVRDPSLDLPTAVQVVGMRALELRLPREAALFRECATSAGAIPSFEWL